MKNILILMMVGLLGLMTCGIVWAQGTINYYTDRGDLSLLLPGASADAFVATAFATWASVPTAAIAATAA